MAKKRGIGQIVTDLEKQINSDYNDLIQMIASYLPGVTPKDTGFLASSWKASTTRPVSQDIRDDFKPWSKYKQGSRVANVKPRFPVPIFNYKKQPTVYIGNTAIYARVRVNQANGVSNYVQGEMGALVAETFRERKAGRIFALTGQGDVAPVGYMKFGENFS